MVMSGRGDEIELEVEKMREALAERWGFIHDLNMKRHKEDALVALERIANGDASLR